MQLLIDIGNSRLKWAQAEQRIVSVDARSHEGDPAALLATIECDAPESIRICSVMGPEAERRIRDACLARWNSAPEFARSASTQDGLVNGYAEPLRLGVDRWIAMLAAWREVRGACIVADAGTALTVDVVDAQGQHLGGLIAAGLKTSLNAVLGATQFPVRASALSESALLGRDTETCVSRGALLSCAGAIEKASSALPSARKFICGGDAAQLLPLLDSDWQHVPHLVLQGLLQPTVAN